jgi:hypothetical protein
MTKGIPMMEPMTVMLNNPPTTHNSIVAMPDSVSGTGIMILVAVVTDLIAIGKQFVCHISIMCYIPSSEYSFFY